MGTPFEIASWQYTSPWQPNPSTSYWGLSVGVWQRDFTKPAVDARPRPYPSPSPMPIHFVPYLPPGWGETVNPMPVPYPVVPSLPSAPNPGPSPEPAPQPKPGPIVGGFPWPSPGPAPGPNPNPGPDPNFPNNPEHSSTPPRPREKEKKLRVPALLMAALKAGHAVTEYKDIVDSIWEGVPKDIRRKYQGRGRTRKGAFVGEGRAYFTMDQKMQIIYRHVNDIDWSVALTELAKNQLEDLIMGHLNSGADKRSVQSLGGNRLVF